MTPPRRPWRAETGLFLGIWLALMILGRSQLFRDAGTLWHVVVGERLLSSGQFLATDPFSFTRGGQPWVPIEWLAECTMAVLHGISGLDGLLLATATVVAVVYAGIGRRLLRSGLHWLPTTVVVAMMLSASSTNLHARPLVVSIGFLAITSALLADFEAGRVGPGRLWWLVPLFVVWTNWHGAVLGGLATLGLAVVGWGLARVADRESPIVPAGRAIPLGLLVVACGLTTIVNPYGLRLPGTWMEIMRSPVVPRLIVEHAPPSPRQPAFWAIVALGIVYGLVLASTLPRWPRVTWLIPLVWFALALSRVRHAPLFAVTAGLGLAEMLPGSRLAAWLARPGRDLFRSPAAAGLPPPKRDWRPALLSAALVGSVALIQAAGVAVPVVGRGWAQLDPTIWPVELLPELRRADRAHPGGARVFNDYAFGGFLIYHTPNLKVFIDDRCEVYGDALLEEFERASTTDPGLMDEWLEQYRVDYILVGTGSVFDRHVAGQPGWALLDRCGVAAFYGRVPVEHARPPADRATATEPAPSAPRRPAS